MNTRYLALFETIKDELIFYTQNPRTRIYRSRNMISFNGDKTTYYAIFQEGPTDEILRLNELFDSGEFLVETCGDFTPLNNEGDIILHLVKDYSPVTNCLTCNIWEPIAPQNELHIVEIDVKSSYLPEYPHLFDSRNKIMLCEAFELINVEELLDCEL